MFGRLDIESCETIEQVDNAIQILRLELRNLDLVYQNYRKTKEEVLEDLRLLSKLRQGYKIEKINLDRSRRRYGEWAESHRALLELERELLIKGENHG